MTEKSVWENRAAWRCTASTTRGCEYPTRWHPSPPEKSSIVLPSRSVTRAPSPWSMTAGTWLSSGSQTTLALRSRTALDLGPGISVTIRMALPIRIDLLNRVNVVGVAASLHDPPSGDIAGFGLEAHA